MDLLK